MSEGNSSKKYDGKIWWEDCSNIVEVNGMPTQDGLSTSDLKNGDTVLVKFGTKSKKLLNGTLELNFEPNEKDMGQVTPSKRAKLSPVPADDKSLT